MNEYFIEDYVGVLNHWGSFHFMPQLELEELRIAFPYIQEPKKKKTPIVDAEAAQQVEKAKEEDKAKAEDKTKEEEKPKEEKKETYGKQKTSVHCESMLAVAFVNAYAKSQTPALLEIGVSKSCCWLCREFINLLRLHYPYLRIDTPGCHGKLTAGWRLPEETPQEVSNAMKKRVEDLCTDIFLRSTGCKKADSIHNWDDSDSSSSEASFSTILSRIPTPDN